MSKYLKFTIIEEKPKTKVKDINFDKKKKVIIDEIGEDEGYVIFLPLPKGYKGKEALVYYIYYKESEHTDIV